MPRTVWNDFVSWPTKTTQQLYKVSTPFLHDHLFKEEEMESVGEVSKVCSQIVVKCLYLARIGRRDILWSVNKLALAVCKMDESLWQPFGAFDLLHSSHMWILTILLRGNVRDHVNDACLRDMLIRSNNHHLVNTCTWLIVAHRHTRTSSHSAERLNLCLSGKRVVIHVSLVLVSGHLCRETQHNNAV